MQTGTICRQQRHHHPLRTLCLPSVPALLAPHALVLLLCAVLLLPSGQFKTVSTMLFGYLFFLQSYPATTLLGASVAMVSSIRPQQCLPLATVVFFFGWSELSSRLSDGCVLCLAGGDRALHRLQLERKPCQVGAGCLWQPSDPSLGGEGIVSSSHCMHQAAEPGGSSDRPDAAACKMIHQHHQQQQHHHHRRHRHRHPAILIPKCPSVHNP